MKLIAVLLASALCISANAQLAVNPVRKISAARNTEKIIIDGDLKESVWKTAPVATDFVEWRPTYGHVEDEKNKTEIRILYDNTGIYIGGYAHEASKDSISRELVGRDVVGVNDFVGVIFDTYQDKINGFGYYVTSLGEQFDAKYSSNGEDDSWNSVFNSAAKIVEDGWTFEMHIPYSAIRFSNSKIQDWGINITRRRSKSGKQLMWNPVDPAVGGSFLAQFGTWTGIQDIKPPVRLSISPYLSAYVNNYPYNTPGTKNTNTAFNGGVDIKYGITQAFTLDMTLVPDFGQVQSDNKILNLTPFEVRYNENRSFFTEGTELFGKGNLFYSRRIGGQPLHYSNIESELKPGESIAKNPTETSLINASKISGRTASGLGIGFFNAITSAQYATIELNGKESRKIETSPLTNYNILVLDQSLKNNSSISLINTNVTRAGTDYDANVTAALWDLYTKGSKWNFYGKMAVSQLIGYKPAGGNKDGYSHSIVLAKSSGRFQFEFTQAFADNQYNHNDMGYFTNNNYLNNTLWASYRWLKPGKWYNRINLNFNLGTSTMVKPWNHQYVWANTNGNVQLKNLWSLGASINLNLEEKDFYEPRVAGRVFIRPGSWALGGWLETNRAKQYYVWGQLYLRTSNQYGTNGQDIRLGNQFRFNKKLSISVEAYMEKRNNNLGYATMYNADSIVFGRRNRITTENTLTVKYNFNNKMGISLRGRHYWSKVQYQEYYELLNDGKLKALQGGITENVNYNVNYFNIDMVYTWQYAKGSFINLVWKNAISTFDEDVESGYFKNLGNTLGAAQQNSLSLRVIYFLDYLSFKKRG
ncbi:MAG: DUF5916 domain-containing protein [Sediminibacterium sp.]|nr:DUF5916 domain-containing protein [Sediminibacterium sp.]